MGRGVSEPLSPLTQSGPVNPCQRLEPARHPYSIERAFEAYGSALTTDPPNVRAGAAACSPGRRREWIGGNGGEGSKQRQPERSEVDMSSQLMVKPSRVEQVLAVIGVIVLPLLNLIGLIVLIAILT